MRPPLAYSPRRFPEPPGNIDWVNASLPPPSAFVTGAMRGPVMGAAERDREFIARLTAERPRLQVAQMMRVRGLATAD